MAHLTRVLFSLCGVLCSFLVFTGLFCLKVIAQGDRQTVNLGAKVIDAINCGGPAHTDVYGIRYRKDPLEGFQGIASDFGRRFLMQRVPQPDQILYQTERYNTQDLEYELTIPDDGDYVLVLKFSEVYFNGPQQKVFDVRLNGEHDVVRDLDIFQLVGKGVAHDVKVDFTVKGGKLKVGGAGSNFPDNKLKVQFIKGAADNPKINAMFVMRGKSSDVPDLPNPINPDEDEPEEEIAKPAVDDGKPSPFASGPRTPDPHAAMDASQTFLPILIALACFFPVLFCLCKL